MNNFFTQLKEKAREIKLTQGDKQAMRMRLYTYLEQNPMGTFEAPKKMPKPTPSMYFFFSPQYMVPVALLLVVGLSGGTAFAAEAALPGEPLYAVKVQVNERVAIALARGSEAKASVHAALATTRLEEAETLAASGKLDATTTSLLASNFAAHAEAAQSNVTEVEATDPGMAAQLGAQFAGSLAAHGAILAQIGDDSSDADTMQNSRSLAIEVDKQAERGNPRHATDDASVMLAVATAAAPVAPEAPSNSTRVRTFAAAAPQPNGEDNASSSTTTTVATGTRAKSKESAQTGQGEVRKDTQRDTQIAASLSAQAGSSLDALSADFAAIKGSLSDTTAAQVAAQIAALQARSASASALLEAGDASAAKTGFGDVINSSIKLDAYLKAGQKFNQQLLNGLLEHSGGNDNSKDGSHDSDGSVEVELHL